jgi:hypothetical protein
MTGTRQARTAAVPVEFNTAMAKVNFYKFRTRARFIQVREELSSWCREVGIADDVLEPLVWDVVALIDARPPRLAAMLEQRVPTLAVALDRRSAKALAESQDRCHPRRSRASAVMSAARSSA